MQSVVYRNRALDKRWLLARVDTSLGEDGCWPWLGFVIRRGYGRTVDSRTGKSVLAHRLTYKLWYGPIPDKMLVCHRCDNPPCCNPRHLFVGTYADNAADMVAKGRSLVGERRPNAVLTAVAVDEIRCLLGLRTNVAELAARFGVSRATIWMIENNRTWKVSA